MVLYVFLVGVAFGLVTAYGRLGVPVNSVVDFIVLPGIKMGLLWVIWLIRLVTLLFGLVYGCCSFVFGFGFSGGWVL